jgi:phytoene dehydrogenase-like protein
MQSFDSIVIGGGTNGLACATKLQGSGHKVLLLETAASPGGAACGWEFAPGYRTPGLAHILNMLDPRVENGMALSRHGLALDRQPLSTTALSESGDHLVFGPRYGDSIEGSLSDADRIAWSELRQQLLTFAKVLAPFKAITPPRLAKGAGNETLRLARLGLSARMIGQQQFREFLRMLLINIHDVLNDQLSDPRLKGLIAFDATLGSWLGPRSPNTLILLLNRLASESAGQQAAMSFPRGGLTTVATAMAKSAESAGVVIRSGTRVARLIVESDRVTGVVLANGEELRARTVVSAINPKTTFLELVGPRHLDTGFVKRLRDQKSRSGAAKLHLALNASPDFRGASLASRLVIAGSEDDVELSYNPAKYQDVPHRPVMEVVMPTAHDSSFAPSGHHVLSAIVQFAPDAPRLSPDEARAEMLENTLAVLENHAPGLRGQLVAAELLMPYDIEARNGMVGGNWHHGELSLEQMFFLRPLPGMAQYRTPLDGLWLAGAGCHPGGGISGAAGWNAAEAIIKRGDA